MIVSVELFAVVRGHDHQGVVQAAVLTQAREQLAGQAVAAHHRRVVERVEVPEIGAVEAQVLRHDGVEPPLLRPQRSLVAGIEPARQVAAVVIGRMGAEQVDPEQEGVRPLGARLAGGNVAGCGGRGGPGGRGPG